MVSGRCLPIKEIIRWESPHSYLLLGGSAMGNIIKTKTIATVEKQTFVYGDDTASPVGLMADLLGR